MRSCPYRVDCIQGTALHVADAAAVALAVTSNFFLRPMVTGCGHSTSQAAHTIKLSHAVNLMSIFATLSQQQWHRIK
jgi:hypothetical protein